MMSTPASSQRRIWSIVAFASEVGVLVMVCTVTGASPPTGTLPTMIWRLWRRMMSRQGRMDDMACDIGCSALPDNDGYLSAVSLRLALSRPAWLLHGGVMDAETTRLDTSDSDGPLLFGRVLDGKGGGRADRAGKRRKVWRPAAPGEVLWVHFAARSRECTEWLGGELAIPEPTVELLTGEQTRPRAFREGEALVATLRGINFNPGAEPEDMVSMQLWCDGERLVTLRRQPLQTPRDDAG